MANTTIGGKLRSGTPADVLAPVAGTVEYVNLHESTLPEAISSSQRHEVAEAYRSIRGVVSPGMIAERLSDILYLELWIVRRRMYELGIGPDPKTKMDRRPSSEKGNAVPRIVDLLVKGPLSTAKIASTVGIPTQSCLSILKTSPDRFECERVGNPPKQHLVWRIRVPVS